jgi:acyl carrier protein
MNTLTVSNNNIAPLIKEIISYKLGLDESMIQNESSFTDDLATDSLDVFEIIVEVEKRLSINIPSEDAEKCKTVGTLIKYVINQKA